MDARTYLNHLLEQGKVVRLVNVDGDQIAGRGHAIILNQKLRIAVMLEDCGTASTTDIRAGDVVEFLPQPESESCIVGSPARIG
jgi:hypothetical protein